MFAQLSRRNLILAGLLAATLAVSAWTLLSGPDDAVVEPTVRGSQSTGGTAGGHRPTPAHAAGAPADLTLAARPAAPAVIGNLFGAYSYQAPAAVAAPAAPSRAHAPALPFTYTGRLDIDGHETYLFLQGEAPISLAVGASIGDFTLVEAAGQTLIFLHGPTGERVSLSIAAVNG